MYVSSFSSLEGPHPYSLWRNVLQTITPAQPQRWRVASWFVERTELESPCTLTKRSCLSIVLQQNYDKEVFAMQRGHSPHKFGSNVTHLRRTQMCLHIKLLRFQISKQETRVPGANGRFSVCKKKIHSKNRFKAAFYEIFLSNYNLILHPNPCPNEFIAMTINLRCCQSFIAK